MDLPTFIMKRRPDWVKLEQMLDFAQGSGLRGFADDEAIEFGRLYRAVASDLNQAQTFVSGDEVVAYLNQLVARGYSVAYGGNRRRDWFGLLKAMFVGYPRVMRANWRPLLVATSVFFLGTGIGFYLTLRDSAFMECCIPAGFRHITPQETGDEEPLRSQTPGEISEFAGRLFANNVGVSLFAFALGVTFGIGTIWLLFYNGLMTGALMVLYWKADQMVQFCAGILPHGVVEIPAIWIGAAGGLIIARAMIVAKPCSRVEEMARAGKEAIMLLLGVVPLLAAAALLEAGLARAPRWLLGDWLKLTVAAVVGLLFIAYIALVGHRKPTPVAQIVSE